LAKSYWSAKTNQVLKQLFIVDHLGSLGTPFYSKIALVAVGGEDDETCSTFHKAQKIQIVQIHPHHLMQFLNEHHRVEKKYYAIYTFVMNDCKESNGTIKK
jgi:hypothetical protein